MAGTLLGIAIQRPDKEITMLFDLIGLVIEGALELAGELFEDAPDVDPPFPPTDLAAAAPMMPLDAGMGFEGTNLAASMDGGNSPDRFDPSPAAGPYTPGR
jgi:hypothetical protein